MTTTNPVTLNENDLELLAAMEIVSESEETAAPEEDLTTALAEANGAPAALEAQAGEIVTYEDLDELIDATLPFMDMLAAIPETRVASVMAGVTAGFAERARFEAEANPNNSNIQKTLTKLQKGHLTPGVMRASIIAGAGENYMNVSEVGGKRRNVYALDKMRDILYGAVVGHMKNAINIACLSSLVRLMDVQIQFTGAVAKACASDKVAIDTHIKPYLSRHTVAESTASTQASSTMTALEDLGVVKNSGTRQHPVWAMTDTPLSKRLVEIVRAKHLPVAA
ncbi:hypothetical protein HGG70_05220 [Rhodobacteraceae bacterium R_SAG4]|nr:hypothetical protein [Rhodobacteraceae bacterium R_SAG4]